MACQIEYYDTILSQLFHNELRSMTTTTRNGSSVNCRVELCAFKWYFSGSWDQCSPYDNAPKLKHRENLLASNDNGSGLVLIEMQTINENVICVFSLFRMNDKLWIFVNSIRSTNHPTISHTVSKSKLNCLPCILYHLNLKSIQWMTCCWIKSVEFVETDQKPVMRLLHQCVSMCVLLN